MGRFMPLTFFGKKTIDALSFTSEIRELCEVLNRKLEQVVCHCYRSDDKVIRIVSTRKANRKEAVAYWR